MPRFKGVILLALLVTRGGGGRLLVRSLPAGVPASAVAPESATAAAKRKILYYRDPSGAPNFSAEPKRMLRAATTFQSMRTRRSRSSREKKPATATGSRKILYYRNPMGLPDTSPVPKKDWMGMDYIPVYEGDDRTTARPSR